MQRWEYKTLTFARAAINFTGYSIPEWSVWLEDETTLPPPIQWMAKLRQLGEQGWELVSVVPISNHRTADSAGYTSQLTYFFKRPVTAGTPPMLPSKG